MDENKTALLRTIENARLAEALANDPLEQLRQGDVERRIAESKKPTAFDRIVAEVKAEVPAEFQAHSSEIGLAKAKLGDNATDAQLIESIKERRVWETAHPNWINEAAARSPKAAHGHAVSRTFTELRS